MRKDSVSIGATRIPENLVQRPHLDFLLDQNNALICVRGEGGLGKSVLVANWVKHLPKEQRVVWINWDEYKKFLDEELNGLSLFDQLQLLDILGPDDLATLASLINARELAKIVEFLAEMLAKQKQPLVIVLEDFDELDPDYDNSLFNLLKTSSLVRLIVISQHRTSFENTKWSSQFEIQVIDSEKLKIRANEVEQLAKQNFDLTISRKISETMAKICDQNFRQVRRLLSEMYLEPHGEDIWSSSKFEDFWQSRFTSRFEDSDFDESFRLFLAVSSLVVPVPADLLGRITVEDSDQLLIKAIERGLGYWEEEITGQQVKHFRYYYWLSYAAKQYLVLHYPQKYREVSSTITHYFIARRKVVPAITFAVSAGQIALVETLLMESMGDLDPTVLLELSVVLRQLPESTLHKSALMSLLVGYGVFTDPIQRENSHLWFKAALKRCNAILARDIASSKKVWTTAIRAVVNRYLGNADASFQDAKVVGTELELLRESGDKELDRLYGLIVNHMGICAFYAEHYPAAVGFYQLGINWADEQRLSDTSSFIRGAQALLESLSGDQYFSEKLLSEIPEAFLSRVEKRNTGATQLLLAKGFYSINRGDYETALSIVKMLESRKRISEHWSHLATVKSLAVAMSGDGVGAEHVLRSYIKQYDDEYSLPAVHHRLRVIVDTVKLSTGFIISDRTVADKHNVRLTPLESSSRAIRLALAGLHEEALEALALGQASTTSQLHRMLTAMAGIALSLRAPELQLELAGFIKELDQLISEFNLNWPLIFFSSQDRLGALAYLKNNSKENTEALDRIQKAFDLIAPVVPDQVTLVLLSNRETQVLRALAFTGNREEIAKQLFVSENTVKTQLSSLYRKLGVSNRANALVRALNLGLIESKSLDPNGYR